MTKSKYARIQNAVEQVERYIWYSMYRPVKNLFCRGDDDENDESVSLLFTLFCAVKRDRDKNWFPKQNAFWMMIMKLLIKIGSQNGKNFAVRLLVLLNKIDTNETFRFIFVTLPTTTYARCRFRVSTSFKLCQAAFICIEIEQFKNCISTLLISKS